jgi:hypothetical protein
MERAVFVIHQKENSPPVHVLRMAQSRRRQQRQRLLFTMLGMMRFMKVQMVAVVEEMKANGKNGND